MVLTALFLVSLVLGIWGLVESGKRFLDACYLTLQLITLNAGLEDGPKVWQLETARFLLPGIGAYVALKGIWLLAEQRLSGLKLEFRAKNHYVICGLGDRGMALARDLLTTSTAETRISVAAVDIDPNNPNIRTFMDLGGIFLEGDAREIATLEQAAIQRAAHLILMTDKDATNLRILKVVKSMLDNQESPVLENSSPQALKCHTHIANRENRALFDDGGEFFPPIRARLEFTVFNVFENAAIELFQTHTLGANADTVTLGAPPVKVLIVGLGRIGEAVLLEAMQLGHFCNEERIDLIVLDGDTDKVQQNFFQRYREVTKHLGEEGLKLWNLRFIDALADVGPLGLYTDILACHDDEDMALTCINNLWERWQGEVQQRPTRFFFHTHFRESELITGIKPFGNYAQACSAENIIGMNLEVVAKRSHEEYTATKLRDNDPSLYAKVDKGLALEEALQQHDLGAPQSQKLSWRSLSLIKQGSNFTEKRHNKIRLQALGINVITKMPVETLHLNTNDFPWLTSDLPEANLLLALALSSSGLTKDDLIQRIHGLAKAEHNRWNAFHVLNNYRYGIKDERKRTHDCLLNWDELTSKKFDTLKYDYYNIYQMLEILRLSRSTSTSENALDGVS
jgi:voltage-gated potassium channel Kch